ncbi:YccT family protein, partial [Vibrio genomosp. F10]|uniref:YccT family protein n=1 Tax=Vibrio genomosp. F10 TaxID=723171 RepID=UPI00036D872A
MKVMNRMLVVGAMITSFAPMAAVDVTIDRNISAVIANGEEVGFFVLKKSTFEYENGQNQIVVRAAQLVDKQGEKEKFNSHPVVITFDAADTTLKIDIESDITRVEHAEAFNKDPRFVVTDKSGKEIKVKQDILPASSGISRDYVKELARYNSKHSIEGMAVAAT